jgi:hypothetical protein
MSTIASLLSVVLTIAFIVGMVKPTLVLGWMKNPNRWKVFGFWILGSVILGAMITTPEEEAAEILNNMSSDELIQNATLQADSGNYVQAFKFLDKIDTTDQKYKESRNLYDKIDGKRKLAEEERIKAEQLLKRDQIVDQLKREIESIDKGIDYSKYRGSVEQLQMELVLFRVWGSLANDNIDNQDAEIASLASKLKSKVQRIQAKEFPILRKSYGKLIAQKLWKEDMYASTNGRGSKYINLSGGMFAANKNKQQFQETVSDVLHQFRYTATQMA